ncbi:RNA polymerase III RPC4-domain-containing protein [Flagelloscypha sp. PMI_526]|nr:RNA polymerase III RPC4-domain-containing protein [Flagelloscypha sp. PMI_526]
MSARKTLAAYKFRPTPKAVPSLAKRPGTAKLKFVPTLPARRKKECEVRDAPISDAKASPRGRGRGRGGPSERGRGGARPPLEMVAECFRRPPPRSNFAPVGSSLSHAPAPSLSGHENAKGKREEDEYSDPDEGVEIVDISNVRDLDWMAPESLKNERELKSIKKEESQDVKMGDVDLANAIDLSESEEEEELEDIIEDFEMRADLDQDPDLRQDRLYFFQFPSPFPSFQAPPSEELLVKDEPMSSPPKKAVSFAPDDSGIPTPSTSGLNKPTDLTKVDDKPPNAPQIDGIIGQLEIYKSGAVKMRLKNGILLEVNAATQPSFLQQATFLDMENKELVVLGEVNKQFIVSPDVDTLLTAMENAEQKPIKPQFEGEEMLISMDTD